MFSESTIEQPIAPGAIFDHHGAGKHVPRYRVEVDIENMTWGDNMIHVRFQLMIELAESMDDDPRIVADPMDTPAEAERKAAKRRAKQAERIQALRDLVDGFGELTAFLDRVATVYRDGVRCPTVRDVPQRFVKEIMAAIGRAKADEAATKN